MHKPNLKCYDCKRVFPRKEAEPKEETTPYEFWGEKGTVTDTILLCPYCESEEVGDFYGEVDKDVGE